MMILRSTTKAFQKLRKKPQLIEVDRPNKDFGEWYINTVDSVNRGNLFMAAMHAESLYTVFVPVEKSMDLTDYVHNLFANLILRILCLEVPRKNAEQIMASYGGQAIFAKTNSKSLVANLATIVKEIDVIMECPDRFAKGNKLDLPLLEHYINDTPRTLNRKTVWPLKSFYDCIRQFCPELPPRLPIPFKYSAMSCPEKLIDVFKDRIHEHLMLKVKASSLGSEVLFSTEEAQTLLKAVESSQRDSSDIPEQLCTDLLRMLKFKVQQLEKQI